MTLLKKTSIFLFYGLLIAILLQLATSVKIIAETASMIIGGVIGVLLSVYLWQTYGKKMMYRPLF